MTLRPDEDWKTAYYTLVEALDDNTIPFLYTLDNKLATEVLLELGHDPSADGNRALRKAVDEGDIEVVKLLLADPRVDPSHPNNRPIKLAAMSGNVQAVKLLLADPRVDPSAGNNYALQIAHDSMIDNVSQWERYAEVITLLKQDPRVLAGSMARGRRVIF